MTDTEPAHETAPSEPTHAEPASTSPMIELFQERARRVNAEMRVEDLVRDGGRKDGVIEVLKEQLRKNQDTPPVPPVVVDQQPVVDAISQLGGSINGKFDAVADALNAVREDVRATLARPVVAPEPEHVVHHTTARPSFLRRWGRSVLISLLILMILLALGALIWAILASRGIVDWPNQPNAPINYFSGEPPVVSPEEPEYSIPYDSSYTDEEVQNEFAQDCAAHGGTIYSADEWNTMGLGTPIEPGELKCYAEARWEVD